MPHARIRTLPIVAKIYIEYTTLLVPRPLSYDFPHPLKPHVPNLGLGPLIYEFAVIQGKIFFKTMLGKTSY